VIDELDIDDESESEDESEPMLKIISTKPRTYRAKRKAKPRKRFTLTSAINFTLSAIAIICALVSIPLLLIAAPFVLLTLGLLSIASACNELRWKDD
jgi:hypothetical protein